MKKKPNAVSKWIVLSFFAFFLSILDIFVFTFIRHNFWAPPFTHQPIAIVKVTDHISSDTTYYALYSNNKTETLDKTVISQLTEYTQNPLYSFHQKFTTVDIVAERYHPYKVYIDQNQNEYQQIPYSNDPQLSAIESDFFNKIEQLDNDSYRLFQDQDIIYIAGVNDCGFGQSIIKFYGYQIPNHHLYYIGSLPNNGGEVVWIYTAKQ